MTADNITHGPMVLAAIGDHKIAHDTWPTILQIAEAMQTRSPDTPGREIAQAVNALHRNQFLVPAGMSGLLYRYAMADFINHPAVA